MINSRSIINRCSLCSSENIKPLYEDIVRMGHAYDIYKCHDCGLAVTCPFPEQQHLSELYSPSTYRAHDKRFIYPVELMIKRFNNSRLNGVREFCSKGRILDIGCARGLILNAAKDDGWETFGLEFSEETALHAKEVLNLDVRIGDIREAGFEQNTFDVITIWHVLEHIKDPFAAIKECSALLKTGGLIALSVPNFDSWQSKMTGPHWFHIDLPYHFYHFSSSNLSLLLKNNSFKIEKIKYYSFEQNPFGFIQSFLNMLGIRNNYLYDTLKTGELRKMLLSFKYMKDFIITAGQSRI